MHFPPALSLGPKILMPSGWPKPRVGSPRLKTGLGHGYLTLCTACPSKRHPCMVPGPFAGASQGLLLIPSTSPPRPSPYPLTAVTGSIPPASTNHCDRKTPLLSVPQRRSSSPWRQGVPHTPVRAWTSLGDSRAGVGQRPSESSWDAQGPWLWEAPSDLSGGALGSTTDHKPPVS